MPSFRPGVFGLLLLLGACAPKPQFVEPPPPPPDPPAPVQCLPHTAAAGAFRDATDDWNLGKTGLAVVGNRIVAADLDGDGYPDLIVHAITSNLREKIGTPPKLVNVLMNRPRTGGGRRFVDATVESGLFQVRGGSTTELRSAHLAVAGDLDNDGDLDIFSGTYVDPGKPATDPGDRSEVMLNDGQGHFTLAPPSAARPLATQRWPTTGATFTDVDRDGRLDLFVGFFYELYGSTYQGLQARLYRGSGDGSFADLTEDLGLKTLRDGFAEGKNHRPAYGVTSCDLDGDGAPELLVSAYGRQWNLLYQNDGTGHFTEVGQASGFAGDALRDYSGNQFFACYCTLHPAQADCVGVAPPLIQCSTPADASWNNGVDDQPWRLNGNTFSTYCGDLDGDAKPDLYSAEIVHWHIGASSDPSSLLRSKSSQGSILFERPDRTAAGLDWVHPDGWNEGGL
ncbi:MAG: FG-GAP repeat domain-containing protein, partial [Myxococcaceae bacterium]